MSGDQTGSGESTVIRGWGLVSPLGDSAWETFSALLDGRTIADRAQQLPAHTDPIDLVRMTGSVDLARLASCDPVVELAQRAGHEALTMAGVGPDEVDCIVGVSKGAVTAVLAAAGRLAAGPGDIRAGERKVDHDRWPQGDDPALAVVLGPCGYLSYHVHRRLGVKPPLNVVAACASSLSAVHRARASLRFGRPGLRPQRILVVSAEASLLPLLIHSYRRLGVLPALNPDQYRGRPLDRGRKGFMLSELGAALVLERSGVCEPGAIELVDTAVACEAFDLVRSAPGMPALRRVADQLAANRTIDLVHPHATGTLEHDPAELAVLGQSLGNPADVYACKGALGHGLGAAGLVALVVACMCAKTGRRPVMPWLDDPIRPPVGGRLSVGRVAQSGTVPRTHAVFAAGFAGHVAGAVIARR